MGTANESQSTNDGASHVRELILYNEIMLWTYDLEAVKRRILWVLYASTGEYSP